MTTSTSSPPLRLRVVPDGPEAFATVLKRTGLSELAVDPAVAARSAAVFDTPELRDLVSSAGLAPVPADGGLSPEQFVERVVRLVRTAGDTALRLIAERLDGAVPADLETPPAEIAAAYQQVDAQFVADLRLAADRIRRFHEHQRHPSWLDVDEGLGQIIRPLERVGLYAPFSTAAYPSSVLMAAIPARVAGVDEVVLAMPPRPDGRHQPEMVVAADIAGVDRLFKVGGAQAIAALAYGTASVPKVDKILGPGNIFVVLAKKRVFGDVDIDQLPGPTETLVIADDTAPADEVAADLLAQAEHDLGSAILITSSERIAAAVPAALEEQLGRLERAEIARESLERRGGIVVTASVERALDLANEYAPEHLCLLVADAWSYLPAIKNAGGVFLGRHSPEAAGDYVAGPSHIMPTGATARFSSPLSVDDFLKITSVIALSARQLAELGPVAARLARAEGLTAHAAAVERRLR